MIYRRGHSQRQASVRRRDHPWQYSRLRSLDTVRVMRGCQIFDASAKAYKGLFKLLEAFFTNRAESLAYRIEKRFQIPLWIFVAPKKFRIDQEPELAAGPVQYRFGKSKAVVAEETKGFFYGFLDSVAGEFCGLLGRQRIKFNVYTLQVQDAFGSQRTGNGYKLVTSQ